MNHKKGVPVDQLTIPFPAVNPSAYGLTDGKNVKIFVGNDDDGWVETPFPIKDYTGFRCRENVEVKLTNRTVTYEKGEFVACLRNKEMEFVTLNAMIEVM